MKEIKDLARQAFREQQNQDNEGGVPDPVSFIAGYLDGYREAVKEMEKANLALYRFDFQEVRKILKDAIKKIPKIL